MSINILKSYMQICEDIGVEPTWEGLKSFSRIIKTTIELLNSIMKN